MPVYKRKKMCSECPFRAESIRGYLGPLTIDELEKYVHGPTKIGDHYYGDVGELICHIDIARLADKGKSSPEIHEQGQQCVGMIRYTNAIMKVSRDPVIADFQDAVDKVSDKPVIERFKLREHHTLTRVVKNGKRTTRRDS